MPSRKSGKSGGRETARYGGDFLLDWIPGCEKGVSYVPQLSLHIVTTMFTSIQTFPMIWQLWSRYRGENLWVMPGPFTALLWQERSIAEVSQRLQQQFNPAIGISFHFLARSLYWRLVEGDFCSRYQAWISHLRKVLWALVGITGNACGHTLKSLPLDMSQHQPQDPRLHK